MSRSCGWCTSYERASWEARVLKGEPVVSVVGDTPFSEAAARRHLRLHFRSQMLEQMGGPDAAVTLSDFAERLVELANQSADVAAYARQTNNGRLILHAIAEERNTLQVLMTRLGIDSAETAQLYADARELGRALAEIVRTSEIPGLGEELAAALDARGMTNLGDALRRASWADTPDKDENERTARYR